MYSKPHGEFPHALAFHFMFSCAMDMHYMIMIPRVSFDDDKMTTKLLNSPSFVNRLRNV